MGEWLGHRSLYEGRSVITYRYVLMLHVLSATVWTGGHLVLACTVLPRALRRNAPQILHEFEAAFERMGVPALVIQVVTGLSLAYRWLPSVTDWFSFSAFPASLISTKLLLLVLTLALALHARLRLIPELGKDNMRVLAAHIVLVTVLSVLFVIVGVLFRA
jgi:putative copper export protein